MVDDVEFIVLLSILFGIGQVASFIMNAAERL